MSIKIMRFKVITLTSALVASVLVLSGCAPTITTNTALEEAKIAYQSALANPTVARNATLELKKAEMALNDAEKLLQQKGKVVEIEHRAYMAKQHAAIAQEIGKQKTAETAIEQAGAERNKVLLKAREAEAELAQQKAATEKAAALKAIEEAKLQKAAAEKASQEAIEQRMAAEKAMAEAAAEREKTAKLQQQIAELEAVKADRGLVMTLGDVVFDVNKADLKPGGIVTMVKLATFLKEYSTRRVMIEGFTDSTGDETYNLGLSERRALSVRQALLDRGVEASRIDFKGYGEDFPVATNDTPAGRQMNRRVEIIISDEEGIIPERTN